MKKNLLKRVSRLILILFPVLWFSDNLLANNNPPTPTCPIVTERFQGLADGTTVNNSSTGWYLDASHVLSTGYFAVKSNRLTAIELGGEGIWYSKVFSVAGYSDFQAAVKVTAEGDMNSSEYVKIYYKINGGAETLLDSRTGNFGTIDFISPVLTGSNVQLVVKIYNYNNGGTQTSKYYIEEYRVFKEHGPCAVGISVSAGAGNGGVLTCSNPSLTLSASTTASGTTTWSWTGPNSFTSSVQNPVITVAGTYTVTGTNAAGSGSASITVTSNKAAPVVTATGGALACAANVTLNATSSVSGSAFSWTGPNGFTSTLQNPSVNAAGSYTVTVTNPSNGCTASQSVTVTAGTAAPVNLWTENFTLANGITSHGSPTVWTSATPAGTFDVENNEFKVNNIGTTGEGVWTSGVINISGNTSVSISAGVRSGVSSSGALENSGSSLDYVRMYYVINGGSPVLFNEQLGTINNNSATNTTVSVSSLSGSTLQVIIRARTTATDEFYYFDDISVTGVNSSATITPAVSGTVTCSNTAQLSATVTNGTVSAYAWTGPNGFSSSLQNPVISAGGQYIVTATLSSGGCSVSAPIMVAENKTAPDITASGGTLSCLPSVTLNVSSAVSGATYSWTGPNSFTSTSGNPVVSVTGTYTATVTNPANGCTASQQVAVTSGASGPAVFWLEDFTLANGTTTDNGSTAWSATTTGTGTYSVQGNEFKTSFSGAAEGVWTSQQINISGKSNVSVSVDLRSETASSNDFLESDDYIRVYYKLDGGAETLFYDDAAGIGNTTTGTASATATISSLNGATLQLIIKTRNSDPTERYYFDNVTLTGADKIIENVTASASGILTCAATLVNLSGSSAASGLSYSWTGPNGFTSALQNPDVSAAGIYTLTVTNPSTGCTGTDTVTVLQDINKPANLAISSSTNSNELTCLVASMTLTGSSTTPGVSYSWQIPSGVIITAAGTGASVEGAYVFTATNPVNGCSASDTFNVVRNMATPMDASVSPSPGFLTCTNSTVTLTATNSLAGVVFNWLRPDGTTAAGPVLTVSQPGFYNVIMTHPVTGCNHTIGVSVVAVSDPPADVAITVTSTNSQINCVNNSVELTGSSSTSGTTYSWAGPNGYTSIAPVAIANDPGEYVLTATNPSSGCTASTSINIAGNTTVPANVSVNAVTNGGLLTCSVTSINLTGASSTAGVNYAWSGPSGFTATGATAAATAAGDYTLTVTDPANGCSANAIATVTQNNTPPAGVLASHSDVLTCLTTSVDLTGSAATPGVSYLWSGPDGFTASSQNTQTEMPGTYSLKVTNPVNGCSRTVTTIVEQDIAPPADVMASNNGPLTCTNVVTLTGSTSAADVDYIWQDPNGNFISFAPTVQVTTFGTFTFTVTDLAGNGCSATVTTTVTVDSSDCGVFLVKPHVLTGNAAGDNSADQQVTTFEHKAYPNPFTDRAFIEFRAAGNDFVTVGIFSNTASREKIIFNNRVIAGRSYKLALDAGNLPAGMHYCIIEVNGKVYSHKLMLIR